jgi:YbbR domain-containing protein
MTTLRRLQHAAWFIGRAAVVSVGGNLSLAVLSLALALSLWLFVNERENPKQVETFNSAVPITFVNVPDGLAIANASETSVRVQVEGTQNDIAKLRVGDFDASVNLGGFQKGVAGVVVSVKPPNSNVNIADVTPLHVDVTLEELRTKEVPVKVSLVGTPQLGFAAGDQTTNPGTVTVSGAESLVALVDSAVAEVPLTGLRVDIDDERVTLKPRDVRGGEISRVTTNPETARVSVKLVQSDFSSEFTVTPTIRGAPAAGYNITGVTVDPNTVIVTGPKDVLQNIDAVRGISTEEISVADQRGDVVRQVDLALPDRARMQTNAKVSVHISIAPARGEFSYGVAPQMRNVRAGLAATLSQPSVIVTLSGDLPTLQALAPESIIVTVDATDLGPGLYAITPQVQTPPGTTVARVDPPQVGVGLSERP